MVVTVSVAGRGVTSNIGLKSEHEQPPDGPWDEVLDGEAPPELKGILPPGELVLFVLAELGHGSSEVSHTRQEDQVIPINPSAARVGLGVFG